MEFKLEDFYLQNQISFFINEAQLQKEIFDITPDNIEAFIKVIDESLFLKSKEGFEFLFNQCLVSVNVRPMSRFWLPDLFSMIFKLEDTANKSIEHFRSLFLKFDQPLLQRQVLLALLSECNLRKVFSDIEIADSCTKFYQDYRTRGYNGWSLVCWFGPILEKHSAVYYIDHLERIDFYYQSQVRHEVDGTNFLETFTRMKDNNWEEFESIIRTLYLPNSPPCIILKDDIDTFKSLASQPDFDINQQIVNNCWEFVHLICSRPRLVQYAAIYKSIRIFDYLIETGVNISLLDDNGHNLIYYVVAGGSLEVIHRCHVMGIEFNKTAIFAAIEFFHFEVFNWLRTFIQFDIEKDHIIHLAAEYNNLQVMLFCIENGCDVNAYNSGGDTPLLVAVTNNSCEAVDLLLKHKLIQVNLRDAAGMTAFAIGAQMGRIYLVERLLADGRFNLNECDSNGYSPLHHAVEQAQLGTVRLLLQNKEIGINTADNNGNTPIHLASKEGFDKCLEELLKREDIDPNVRNNHNMYPIFISTKQLTAASLKLLLNCPKVDKTVVDNEGRGVLHFAAIEERIDFIKLIIEAGIDINVKDQTGSTPFHVAAENGAISSVKFFINYPGIDLNVLDDDHSTPLHTAIYCGEVETVNLLVNTEGVDVYIKNIDGVFLSFFFNFLIYLSNTS